MADVAPSPASQPLILNLNEPHMLMDEIVERRFSTPSRIEGPPSEDMLGAEGAFPNVRKAYWRSASWTAARGPRSLLQRTTSGKAMSRMNGRGLVEQESNMGKGKGLRIQVDNGWKGDIEVIKLGDEKGSTAGAPEKLNRLPRGIPAMHLDLGALQMDSQNIEPTEIQARRTKFAYFEKHCSRVAEHVYLGSDVVARNREILTESGITHVLNCVGFVCPEYFLGELVYKTLWLQDIPGEDLMSILYDIFDYLEEVRLQHGRVLVHCCQGVSRSTSLVIAYLMWRNNRSFDETFRDVKAIRGTANPNMGFACQLLQWQKRITWGENGEPPSHSGRLYRVAPQSAFSPLHLVPKPVGKLRASELDRRGVFVVDAPNGEVFVWLGEESQPSMAEAGGRIAAQLLRYERAKGPVTVVRQGLEGAVFWQVLSAGGGDEAFEERLQQRTGAAETQEAEKQRRERTAAERASPVANESGLRNTSQSSDGSADVGTVSAYDADYDLFRRAAKGEIKPATPGCSVLPGPVKSTSVPASPKKPANDIRKQVSHSAASTPKGGPVSHAGFEAEPESVPQPGASFEPRPEPSLNRKQAQPDVFVPSVSRSYPVSTLPPPSPSLPPPNKRSKSPTTTEQNADVLSPPPQSPSSSMGSFYKQHRVLSPRPGTELTEQKPRKSPSILGPGGERRSSLSDKTSLKLSEGATGGRLPKESGSESPRQPRPPVVESRSAQPSFFELPSFASPEQDWAVPESPRVSRRTSFPGFSAGGNQGEMAKTPATRMGRLTDHQLPEDAELRPTAESPTARAESGSDGERSRESTPSGESNASELVRTSSSDGSASTDADEWTTREPGSKATGAEAAKPNVTVPASPVGPLPGSGIVSPGLSEEAENLVDERRSPTLKQPELLMERRELVEVRGSPMDVDRRRSLDRGSTELHSSGGAEKVDDEPGPRLFEAPHFGEVQMFDTDDLHSESAYILLVDADGGSVSDNGASVSDGKKRHELYVWLGSGFSWPAEDRRTSVGSTMSTDSEDGDDEGRGLGKELLRRRGLPLDSPIVVVVEGKEPDEFWSHFVNG